MKKPEYINVEAIQPELTSAVVAGIHYAETAQGYPVVRISFVDGRTLVIEEEGQAGWMSVQVTK